MADSFIQAAADGAGKKLDTRTEGSNSEHRQVIIIGDPATNAGVAPVDATRGLAVDLTASGALTTVSTVSTVTNLSQLGGVAIAMGTGARSAGTQRVTIATDDSVAVTIASVPSHAVTNAGTFAVQVSNANANGRALPGNSAPVVLNSMTYKSCPASSTTILGTTGATGDYLDGVLIIPGAAAAGIVQLKDGTGTAFNIFAGGGTTALPTLAPFYVPIGAISSGGTGGWQVITNANVTAVAIGNGT